MYDDIIARGLAKANSDKIEELLGYIGSSGIQGYTGSQGIIGYNGSLGYIGSIGYTGSIGYSGSQGISGYTGSIGYTGSTITDHTLLTNIGVNTHNQIDKSLAKTNNYSVLQKDPTGFTNCENIIVTYDSTARTITLTGDFEAYYQGVKVPELTNGWVSMPHPTTLDKTYFLSHNGTAFVFDDISWTYDNIQIAVVQYGTNNKIAIRECHGFMPWMTHLEFHQTIGAYKSSGGTLTPLSYVTGSNVNADRRPLVDTTIVYDEDLKHSINALTTETYTQRYLVGNGAVRTFVTGSSEIIPVVGTRPRYNQNIGGTWSQTEIGNNNYAAIWLVAVPVTNDINSQLYRYLWIQPQTIGNLSTIRSLSPIDVYLGDSADLLKEFIYIVKIIIHVTVSNWVIEEIQNLTGNRFVQTGSPAGAYLSIVQHDSTLNGDGTSLNLLSVANPIIEKTPISQTDTGVKGTICWDANYIYICTATNYWERAIISSW